MGLFGKSNDSVDQAKGSAQGTADQTKRAAGDVADDVKSWGKGFADQAKGSAQSTADQTKRGAGEAKDDAKQWGRGSKDSASDSWEQTKRWGKGTGNEVEGSVDSTLKQGDAKKNQLLDLGHPLLNRVFDGFVKVAGVGAAHTASTDSYKLVSGGDTSQKSLEKSARKVGKDALQWGLVGGVYSGVTYGIEEAQGTRDWKTALLGGLVAGAALSLTEANPSTDLVLNSAITGAAIATAGKLLHDINS